MKKFLLSLAFVASLTLSTGHISAEETASELFQKNPLQRGVVVLLNLQNHDVDAAVRYCKQNEVVLQAERSRFVCAVE